MSFNSAVIAAVPFTVILGGIGNCTVCWNSIESPGFVQAGRYAFKTAGLFQLIVAVPAAGSKVQASTALPRQTPDWHLSPLVHGFASSHVDPLLFALHAATAVASTRRSSR